MDFFEVFAAVDSDRVNHTIRFEDTEDFVSWNFV